MVHPFFPIDSFLSVTYLFWPTPHTFLGTGSLLMTVFGPIVGDRAQYSCTSSSRDSGRNLLVHTFIFQIISNTDHPRKVTQYHSCTFIDSNLHFSYFSFYFPPFYPHHTIDDPHGGQNTHYHSNNFPHTFKTQSYRHQPTHYSHTHTTPAVYPLLLPLPHATRLPFISISPPPIYNHTRP